MQRVPVTTAAWPLDDTVPQGQPTPRLSHTVLMFRLAQTSHSKQTATRYSLAQALTAALFVVWTAAETPQSKKAGNTPTLPAKGTANLLLLYQSPPGSDRTLQAQESSLRLSDFPRLLGKAQITKPDLNGLCETSGQLIKSTTDWHSDKLQVNGIYCWERVRGGWGKGKGTFLKSICGWYWKDNVWSEAQGRELSGSYSLCSLVFLSSWFSVSSSASNYDSGWSLFPPPKAHCPKAVDPRGLLLPPNNWA